MLDIGAGHGALTRHLVDAGARVLAVEPHPGRAARLRALFDGSNVTVVERDVLTMSLPQRPFRVVASPPYRISAPLLRMLLASRSGLVAADLVLPRAVVRRAVERAPPRWHVTGGMLLPRTAFRPPPQVDSAVLVVRRRGAVPRPPRSP